MGFWDGITSGAVSGLLGGAGEFAKDIRTALTGEESITAEQRTRLLEQSAALEAAVLQADLTVIQGQLDINKIEAADPSLFKSGWRPSVGWVCVFGLGYTFLLRPLLPWVAAVLGWQVPPLPAIDMGELTVLLGGLLGLGGFRSFERIRGKA
jgi:hypothetical protein